VRGPRAAKCARSSASVTSYERLPTNRRTAMPCFSWVNRVRDATSAWRGHTDGRPVSLRHTVHTPGGVTLYPAAHAVDTPHTTATATTEGDRCCSTVPEAAQPACARRLSWRLTNGTGWAHGAVRGASPR